MNATSWCDALSKLIILWQEGCGDTPAVIISGQVFGSCFFPACTTVPAAWLQSESVITDAKPQPQCQETRFDRNAHVRHYLDIIWRNEWACHEGHDHTGQQEAVLPALLTSRDVVFKAGPKCLAGLHTAELSCAIRGAKLQRAQMVQNHFADSVDWWHMWWVFQTLTDQKTPLQASDSVSQLPDSLNDFCAQFEAPHNTSHLLSPPHWTLSSLQIVPTGRLMISLLLPQSCQSPT